MSDPQIRNVVAVASLDQKIDLPSIIKVFENVENRPKFPGLVFRLERPKTTTLLFSTGRMVCVGARSEKGARSAVKKVVRKLKNEGIIILGEPRITIQNVVASADVGGDVDIEKASEALDNILYEPDQFPGAIYRMDDPRVVILIFHTGKLVITGAKREEEVHKAVDRIRLILMKNDLIH